jgi:hypothetical protein
MFNFESYTNMMNILKKKKSLVVKLILVIGVFFIVGVVIWYGLSGFGNNMNERSSDYQDLDEEEILIRSSYEYIFQELIDDETYKEDPIEAFEASVITIEDGKREFVQEDWIVGRFWDYIYISYLLGEDKSEFRDRAVKAKEFFYENAVPFAPGPHSKSSDFKAEYMSNNKLSVCYPLKFPQLLTEDEQAFFQEACINQYSDPEWVALYCHNYGNYGKDNLQELFNLIKNDESDTIKTLQQEIGVRQWDRGDKAVDFFILDDYYTELLPLYEQNWEDWDFSEIDYEKYEEEIKGNKSISTNPGKLKKCLRTRGYREIATTLMYIYAERIKAQDEKSDETYTGFYKTPTYSLISTLEYLRNSDYLTEEEKKLFSEISIYLIEYPDFYKRRYDYYHGMNKIALTELCLVEDDSNVKYLQEIWDLGGEAALSDKRTSCNYVESVIKPLIEEGYCTEEDKCFKWLLFDEPYEGKDGVERFSASSLDTFRVLTNLKFINRKHED